MVVDVLSNHLPQHFSRTFHWVASPPMGHFPTDVNELGGPFDGLHGKYAFPMHMVWT